MFGIGWPDSFVLERHQRLSFIAAKLSALHLVEKEDDKKSREDEADEGGEKKDVHDG